MRNAKINEKLPIYKLMMVRNKLNITIQRNLYYAGKCFHYVLLFCITALKIYSNLQNENSQTCIIYVRISEYAFEWPPRSQSLIQSMQSHLGRQVKGHIWLSLVSYAFGVEKPKRLLKNDLYFLLMF